MSRTQINHPDGYSAGCLARDQTKSWLDIQSNIFDFQMDTRLDFRPHMADNSARKPDEFPVTDISIFQIVYILNISWRGIQLQPWFDVILCCWKALVLVLDSGSLVPGLVDGIKRIEIEINIESENGFKSRVEVLQSCLRKYQSTIYAERCINGWLRNWKRNLVTKTCTAEKINVVGNEK